MAADLHPRRPRARTAAAVLLAALALLPAIALLGAAPAHGQEGSTTVPVSAVEVPVGPPPTALAPEGATLTTEPTEDDAPAYLVWGLVICAFAIVAIGLGLLRARRGATT
jgi:hypothetical protein